MKRLVLSADADLDLVEIWHFSANHWGFDQANRYLRILQNDLDRLQTGTAKGKPSKTLFPHLESDLKLYLSGKHYIIYRESHSTLDVAAIVHGARYKVLAQVVNRRT